MARPPAARPGASISIVADTGHTMIEGPTGAGKSVALGVIVANARAVPGMQIFFMDKGYSAFVLTKALGGQHLDLGEEEVPLQPLARIDDPTDRMKIQGLLEDWIALQNVKLLPQQTKALYRALELIGRGAGRAAHHHQSDHPGAGSGGARRVDARISLAGPLGRFLDADRDVLLDSDFVTFELETLMGMGPKVTIPVLTYLFHRIEQRLDGRPTLIIIDEAWVVLANATFGAKLEEWLRTLAQEERGGRTGDPESQRDRQFALSRRHPGVVSDQALSAQRRGAQSADPRALPEVRALRPADRHHRRGRAQARLLLRLAARAAALPVRAGTGGAGFHRRRFEGGRAHGAADDRRVRRALARRVAARSRASVNGRTTSIGHLTQAVAAVEHRHRAKRYLNGHGASRPVAPA